MKAESYFDEHGRCVPGDLHAPVHKETRRYFLIKQPNIDYAKIHGRLKDCLGMDDAISATEFADRAEKIVATLAADPACANILKGVRVPFMLPKTAPEDIGKELETTWIKAVSDSFLKAFPERQFNNHHKSGLANTLSLVVGSRHERLIESMAQAPLVGYYFPCLTEYSVPAAIEQVANLPDHFLLAGGFDTAAALVGSPTLLLRKDGYPHLLWLAALSEEKKDVGYHFETYGYNLTFNRRVHFGGAAESWASGLVVLG